MSETQSNSAIEAKIAEQTIVLVELSEAQVKALVLLDKFETREELATACVRSRIKGALDAYSKSAKVSLEKHYDSMAKRMKLPVTKDAFISGEMAEIKSILASL